MLEQSKNHSIEKAYLKILESQNSPQREYAYHCTNIKGQSDSIEETFDNEKEYPPKKNWAMIRNVNSRREIERQRQLVPAEFSASMKFDRNRDSIVLSGVARNKILQEADSTRNGIENISMELHLSDDGKRLLFDLTIYPLKEWDSAPLKSVWDYFVDYAPWIAAYNTKRIVEQRISFLRYELKDKSVLNKARSILGLDSERTDFVQMNLF